MNRRIAIILGVCFVLGCFVLGVCQRFELVVPGGDCNMYLLDRMTGNVWSKSRQTSTGSYSWTKESPRSDRTKK